MSNYIESKKELNRIRNEYSCKGDFIFRSALQMVVEHGQSNFQDAPWFNMAMNEINNRHDAAEEAGKILFMSRNFEISIIECAKEIASVNTYDLLIYVQREIWLSNEGMDYQRAMDLLKSALEYLEGYNNCNNKENYEAFCDIGLDDDEMEAFGFEYLVQEHEEEDE